MTPRTRHSRWTTSLLLAWAAGLAGVAPADPGAVPTAVEQVLEVDRSRQIRLTPFGRLRLSYPQQVSAGIGALVAKVPPSFPCTVNCKFRGLALQVEPGLAGGQIAAGYAVVAGGTNHRDRFISKVYLAYGVKAALLRTWKGSTVDPESQTLLGVEGEVSVINVNFSLGVFRHAGSGEPDHDWLVSGGIGWGF
jgi:hypothetical protein